MKQSHIREWEENNRLIMFKSALICGEKKQEKLKIQGRGASYKFNSFIMEAVIM